MLSISPPMLSMWGLLVANPANPANRNKILRIIFRSNVLHVLMSWYEK